MALTGAQLADEVQVSVGRTTSSEPLITNARVTLWLNEAQLKIAEECIGLESLSFKNTTSLDTSVQLKYSITDITVTDTTEKVNRIWYVGYLDGDESIELNWMFPDEFDEEYPDPTHSDIPKDRPTHWTRRGGYIEMFPLCLTEYCNKNLRFDGDFYPREFTTEDASYSDLSNADKGLKLYAIAEAWGAIGNETKSLIWRKKFDMWLDDFKADNENLPEWGGKMYGNGFE